MKTNRRSHEWRWTFARCRWFGGSGSSPACDSWFIRDRGSQYTSNKTKIRHRDGLANGGVDDSSDNASVESFVGVLKRDVKKLILSDTRAAAAVYIHDYAVNPHTSLRRAYLRRNRNERSWRIDVSKRGRAPWKLLFEEAWLDNQVST